MKRIITTILILSALPFLILIYVWWMLPSEKDIRGCITTTMFQVELCNKSPNYTKLKQISPYLKKVILLTEDSLFYEHKGFDWDSIKRNYEENKKAGKFKRGGSTITQQLAKNMFLNSDRTLTRKALEALITMKIEKTISKNEIYEKYLNIVEFGKNIFGIKQASYHYFKKPPSQLNVVESSFLAMLLPNPKKYSASFYKKELTPFASQRIRQIINNMYQYKRINESEFHQALLDLELFFPSPIQNDITDEVDEDLNQLTLENLEEESENEDRF